MSAQSISDEIAKNARVDDGFKSVFEIFPDVDSVCCYGRVGIVGIGFNGRADRADGVGTCSSWEEGVVVIPSARFSA
jgi:hypothetical protein